MTSRFRRHPPWLTPRQQVVSLVIGSALGDGRWEVEGGCGKHVVTKMLTCYRSICITSGKRRSSKPASPSSVHLRCSLSLSKTNMQSFLTFSHHTSRNHISRNPVVGLHLHLASRPDPKKAGKGRQERTTCFLTSSSGSIMTMTAGPGFLS